MAVADADAMLMLMQMRRFHAHCVKSYKASMSRSSEGFK